MLRFLFGILLVQAVTAGLFLFSGASPGDIRGWLPMAVAAVAVGVVASFWFATLAQHQRSGELERLRAEFARERADLRVKAERDKQRAEQRTRKSLVGESRRAEARANRKVAMIAASAGGLGVLMIFASSLALGLSLLTGAGGALAGYITGRRWPTRGETPLLPGDRFPLLQRLTRPPDRRASHKSGRAARSAPADVVEPDRHL
jgi:hypothetical protein